MKNLLEELADKVEDVEIDVEGGEGDSSDEEAESKDPLEEIKEEEEGGEGSEDHIEENEPQEADEDDVSETSGDEEGDEDVAVTDPQGVSEDLNAIEFPDTNVKIGYDRYAWSLALLVVLKNKYKIYLAGSAVLR